VLEVVNAAILALQRLTVEVLTGMYCCVAVAEHGCLSTGRVMANLNPPDPL
jgi:hypothetical protein